MGTLAIVGAGGVLGTKLVACALERTDDRMYAFTHGTPPASSEATSLRISWQPLELSSASTVREALERARPSLVINSAAMINVDACEARRDEALAANAHGPRALAEACVQLGAALAPRASSTSPAPISSRATRGRARSPRITDWMPV